MSDVIVTRPVFGNANVINVRGATKCTNTIGGIGSKSPLVGIVRPKGKRIWRKKMSCNCDTTGYCCVECNQQENEFITKDSGKRQEFSSGMVRDVQDDKPQYDLVDWDMIKRWAELMARGAKKYGKHNWKLAAGEAELERFKASALRHCIQWFAGDTDEDHGAAVYFNIAGAEMVKRKMK